MNQGTVRPLFTPSPLALRCSGLRVRFGRTQALDGLDLELAAGDAVGIVGRNGAGKTTLFRCLVGAETPDAGTIASAPAMDRSSFLANTGFVPDQLGAYDWMTCGSAIDFVARLQPAFDRAWSDRLVNALAIDRAARVTDLSRGMQARLAFVLGLSHRPGLVLLDEPLLGVDVVTHDVVLEMLAALRAETGCTLLVASHQLGDLARLTDRVAFMDRGRIQGMVETESLTGGTCRLTVRGVPDTWEPPAPRILVRRQPGAVVVTVEGDGHAIAEEFRRAHAGAEVDVTVLSINEACADRMRAMEGI
ncbi:MAG: ABC transporter ATP-binding protein [Proteobacteria bacterium]|nr:ABC transporter ATP-binding protein [Pseudomonadota bacterium]